MKNTKVAYRYAKSLLGLASERGETDRIEADFGLMLPAMRENRELRVFLNSPVVNSDKKEKVLQAVFGAHVSELMNAFMRILTAKGRETLLLEIAESYLDQIRRQKGIMSATVLSAVPIDDEVRQSFSTIVKTLNKEGDIALNEEVDPELIGGFKLIIEDTMVDASVQAQLKKLRMAYSKNLYESAL
jgi:F-type H+-transporting ATPase subunit delta